MNFIQAIENMQNCNNHKELLQINHDYIELMKIGELILSELQSEELDRVLIDKMRRLNKSKKPKYVRLTNLETGQPIILRRKSVVSVNGQDIGSIIRVKNGMVGYSVRENVPYVLEKLGINL